jgi:hypothetical protein
MAETQPPIPMEIFSSMAIGAVVIIQFVRPLEKGAKD